MNKMRRTVALFIAMLMLFSCVQGGVFTAMAVDDVSDEQNIVEEVSVAEEPSEPSEADEVGSEQPNESAEESQGDVVTSEEYSEADVTESTEVETSEPFTEPGEEEVIESSEVSETTEVVEETVAESSEDEATVESEDNQEYSLISFDVVNDNGVSVEKPVIPSPKRAITTGTVSLGMSISFGSERQFEWKYSTMGNWYASISSAREHIFDDGTNSLRLFCIQPNLTSGPGSHDNGGSADWPWTQLSSAQQEAMKLAIKYGYPNMPLSGTSDKVLFAVTQTLVWEFLMGYRSSNSPYSANSSYYGSHYGKYYSCTTVENAFKAEMSSSEKTAYDSALSNVLWRMKNDDLLTKIPSFTSGSYTMSYDSATSSYKITLTDTNGILNKYTLSCTTSGVSPTITYSGDGNNTVTISVPTSVTAGTTINFSLSGNLKSTLTDFKIYRALYSSGSVNPKSQYLMGISTSAKFGSFSLKVPTTSSSITLKKASDTESVANKIFCLHSDSLKPVDTHDSSQNGWMYFKTNSSGNAYIVKDFNDNYATVSPTTYTIKGVLDGTFDILERPASMSTGASLKSVTLKLTPGVSGSKVSISYVNESGNTVKKEGTSAISVTIANIVTVSGWKGVTATIGGLSNGAKLSIEFNNETESGWSELSKVTTDGSSKSGFCFKFVNNSASNFATSIKSTWYGKTNTSGKMYVTNSSYSSTSATYKFTGMYDGYYSITEDLVKSGKKDLCEPTKWTVKITDSAGAVTTKTFTKASNTLSSQPSTSSKTEGIYKDSSGNYTLYVNVVGLSGGGSMSVTVENTPTSKKFTLKKTVNTSSAMTTCLNQLVGNSLYDLSMSGAEYEVYVNGVYTETIKFTSGNSTTHVATAVSKYSYNVGDRIGVKETKAPKGFKLDSTTYYFTISSTDSQNVFTVTDVPAFDPPWSLTKIDDGTRNPQGDGSFEGAVFKFEYFDAYYSNDIVPSSAVADATWYFETNENGRVYYMEKYLSSEYDLGQPLFYNSSNKPQLPLGTVRITEVKNPLGYLVLPRPLYHVFKDPEGFGYWEDGSAQLIGDLLDAEKSANDGDYSKYYEYFGLIEEEDLFGSFTLQKKLTNSGTELQGNIHDLEAEFNVINRSANSVKIGDFDEAEPGEVCFSFWTDRSGYYASEKIFPIGTYEIVEVTPPVGTKLNTTWKGSFVVTEKDRDSYPLSYECENSPVLAGFKLYKFDKDRLDTNKSNINYPQGGANFNGATFAVYNESDHSIYRNGVEYKPGTVCYTFSITGGTTVRPVNSYTSATNVLPFGSYRIVETKSPTGYFLNEDWEARFDITSSDAGKNVNANSRLSSPLPEEIYRGGVQIKKLDSETGEAWQGDAVMNGAVFAIYNNSEQAVYTDRDGDGNMAWYNKGQICLYLTTDGDGVATSSTDALPYGSYYAVEVEPPAGYKLNADWKAYFNIRTDGQIVTKLTDLGGKTTYPGCEDEIIRGGFSVEKVDIDRAHTQDDGMFGMPQGSASLQATMSVFNCSNYPVRVNGVDYEDGSVCFTFTLDENGRYTSASDLLPYGYYVIKEAEAPDGYKLNEKWSASFYITEDGKIVEANSYTSNIFDEEVIRGGVKVVKEDSETGETPQGEANFGGTTFAVINRSEESVFTDIYGDNHWDWYDIGEICLYLSVEKDYNVVTSSSVALPYGYYEIVEYDVGGGYLLNEEFDAFFEIKEDGKVVEEFYDAEGNLMEDNVVKNEVIRGGVYLEKYDSLMEGNYAGRKEHFEGITFSIYSENDNPVVVDGVTYNKGDAVLTIPLVLTEDPGTEEGDIWSAQTALDALPYGTYTIKENPSEEGGWLANEYYFLSEEGHRFSIVEDGKLVLVDNSGKLISFHNLPIGRIEVKKVDQQGNALPKCKFILEFSEDGSYWEPVVYSEKHLEGGCSSEGLVDGCLWTDNNGIAAFEGLDPTLQYRITELETVNGYTLMSAPAYTGVLERNDDSRFELKIVVINSGTFGFPPTGLNDLWYIPLFGTALFVLGLGALGCTVYYLKRKKKSTM